MTRENGAMTLRTGHTEERGSLHAGLEGEEARIELGHVAGEHFPHFIPFLVLAESVADESGTHPPAGERDGGVRGLAANGAVLRQNLGVSTGAGPFRDAPDRVEPDQSVDDDVIAWCHGFL